MGAEEVTVVDCLLRKYEALCSIPHQHPGKQINRKTSLAGSKAGNKGPRSSLKLWSCKTCGAAKIPMGMSIHPAAKWGACAEAKNHVASKSFDDTQLCPL